MSNVTIFSAESAVVSFEDKKGGRHEMSAEGALFKGGLALAALKDKVMFEAVAKAANGKYRASADIISAAFGATTKAFDKLMGTPPWTNKGTMRAFLHAIERAAAARSEAGKMTAKQVQAMALVKALRAVPSLAAEDAAPVTIEANIRRVA